MKLTFSVTGLKETREAIKGFSDRRFASIGAAALNKTAFDVRDGIRTEMTRVFDRPVPYTLNSLAVKRADIGNLTAEVGFKEAGAGRISASKYLMAEVKGGRRRKKAFEKKLDAAGLTPPGRYAVPGPGVRLDQHGNLPLSTIKEILSHVQANDGKRASRNLSTARRLRGAQKRIGGKYIVVSEPGKGLAPGIWRRDLAGRSVAPVVLFVRPPDYAPRLDFEGVAVRIARERLPFHLNNEFRASLGRLAARGG